MRDVNRVTITGSVGSIDFRNKGVVSLTIATNASYKDKTTGEMKVRTEWHRAVCFDKLGAKLKEYEVAKGSRLMLEGELRTNAWKDKEGVARKTTEIICKSLEVVARKPVVQEQPKAAIQTQESTGQNYDDCYNGGY